MCPTVLAGQSYDLQEAPETIAKVFIRDRWNLTRDGLIPAKDDITFSLFGWSGRKSYQISVEPFNSPTLMQLNIGSEQMTQYNDPMMIHVYIVKNRDEVPPQMHHITQKIEQIIRENVTNVGFGITAIRLLSPFSAIDPQTLSMVNQTEVSLWHSSAIIELLYYRLTTGVLSGVRRSRTHKYNIEVV